MTPEDMRNGKGKTEGYAITFYPVRWKPYSPKSQQFKRGCKGRWQKMNEYAGWDNCEPPKEVHYSPDLYAELATQAVKIAELKAERDQAVEEAQGSDEVLLQYVAQVKEHEATIAAQAAEIERLREAIKYADSLVTIEINPSNYGHDDVCLLNDQTTEALLHLLAALKSEGE